MENTSGLGQSSSVPEEIKGWSWGAFLFNWVWGIFNQTYIALLCLVPFVGVIMVFIVGFKGREWAWRNNKWESIDHFRSVQRKWSICAIAFFGLSLLLGFVALLVTALLKGPR